jgi:uncharacterized protein YjbI with pentapeptide repeats
VVARRVGPADQLRDELAKFVSAEDRTPAAVDRIGALADRVESVPWREELLFVAGHYAPSDEATGEEPLAALAQLVLDDWATKRPEPRWRLRVPEDAKGLQARWLDEAGRERADAVSRALSTGKLGDLAFGTYEGRLDLRGFVDPKVQQFGLWWRGVQDVSRSTDHPGNSSIADLDGVDFSGATFDSFHLDRKVLARSRFDGVAFRDFRLWASTIRDVSFRGSGFGDTPILDGVSGRWRRRGCTFASVDFSGADLSGVMVDNALFEDCDFSGARLAKAMFACDLVRCRFAGHLHDVRFSGRRGVSRRSLAIEDVDLTGAELHYVDFRAVDLAAFRLPVDRDARVVPNWPCVHSRLKKEFRGKPDAAVPLAVRLALLHEPAGLPSHGAMVIELATLREDCTGEEVAHLELLLDRAEESCRS